MADLLEQLSKKKIWNLTQGATVVVLKEAGFSTKEIAVLFQKSVRSVQNLLRSVKDLSHEEFFNHFERSKLKGTIRVPSDPEQHKKDIARIQLEKILSEEV